MENKKNIINSIFLFGFTFGLITGLIEGLTILLQTLNLAAQPSRILGDSLINIINVLFLSILGNIGFIIIMNFTIGIILYLILRKFAPKFSEYAFAFNSGFFMTFNILAVAFISNYYLREYVYPLPAFMVLRSAFYASLASIGAIMLYRYIISKIGREKALRLYMCTIILAIIYAPIVLIVNRVHIPFSVSVKSILVNIGFIIALAVSFFVLIFLYKLLSKKFHSVFNLHNPVIPIIMYLIMLSPFLATFIAREDIKLKPKLGDDVPNVVLISIDTLRADALSTYGNNITNTRYMDSLADNGIRFDNAFSVSPWTKPSIASFMTSLYPTTSGVDMAMRKLDGKRETIAQVFSNAGYNTVAAVTNGWNKDVFGFNNGFDYYHFQGDAMWVLAFGNSIWFKPMVAIYNKFSPRESLLTARNPNQANFLIDKSKDLLKRYKDTNFFMWIHLLDPHDPYTPPPELLPKFAGDYRGRYYHSSGQVNDLRKGILISDEDKRHIENLYLAEVQYTDSEVGRFLDQLEEYGLMDNTIIVIISDHGEEFWEHNNVTHGHNLYWHQLHIPFLLQWKDRIEPKAIEERVSLLDLKPTLLSLCNLEAQEIMQGIDISGLIFGGDDELSERLHDRDLFAEALIYYEQRKGIFDADYKYVFSEVTHREELYNLRDDPYEQFNLAVLEPELLKHYRKVLDEWEEASKLLHDSLPQSDRDTVADIDEATLNQLRGLGYIN